MNKIRNIRPLMVAAVLSVLGTAQVAAEPIAVKASAAGSVSELAARWLGPSRPMTPAESPEERVAAAIRLVISGGRRDGFDGSGGYHTQPGDVPHHMAETTITR